MKPKRILCADVSNIIFCMTLIRLPIQVSAADITYENLVYSLKYNEITITGCSEDAETLVIPEQIDGNPVTEVESQAFANHTNLKHVELPDSLYELGDRAFVGCTALESVNLPENLYEIKHNTFNRCSALKSIVIPDSVRTIGTGAFRNCTSLAEITFPKQLDTINTSAFTDTAWLDNQPDGFVCISNVLYGYHGMMPENTELTLDPSVTVIANGALAEQSNLTKVTFHRHVTNIGWGAFQKTGIVSAEIPPLSQIKNNTFSDCKNLKSVIIPGTVESIDSSAFAGCINLESVTLHYGIQTVGMHAFLNCHALNSITVPASVKYISSSAFGYRTPDDQEGDNIQFIKASDDFTVYGYPYTAAETYAGENGFLFAEPADAPAAVPGDVNCDGSFRISDAVLFQKWLLADPDIAIKKPENADLNADGRLDASDLSLMKQALMLQPAQDLKIKISWDRKNRESDEICRFLQDSIERQAPDFDFTKFTFEWRGSHYLSQPMRNPIGDSICFMLYYQDIPLDYETYPVKVELCEQGRYELNAYFLTSDFIEKLAAIDTTGLISEQEAIDAAKAYASELKLATETGKYQPSERFGEEIVLMYYNVEDACLAFKVQDTLANHFGSSYTYHSVWANVFVNAKTGNVLENRFREMVAIS